jgi:hypothetical protein
MQGIKNHTNPKIRQIPIQTFVLCAALARLEHPGTGYLSASGSTEINSPLVSELGFMRFMDFQD